MSESVFLGSSHVFVDELLDLDNEMKAKICEKDKSVNDINQIYLDRLSLYEKACILPLSERQKILLQDKKEDIYLELKMLKINQDIKKQLGDIQTHLDDLKENL